MWSNILILSLYLVSQSLTRANPSPPVSFTPENNVRNWPASNDKSLFKYVAQLDSSFQYFDTGIVVNEWQLAGRWKAYVLNVTSQQWLSPDLVSISKWTHYVAIVIPADIDAHNKVMLYVTGGSNENSTPPTVTTGDLLVAAELAVKSRCIGAVVFQIPNEPLVFKFDPEENGKRRSEDGIVAYTWWRFFQEPEKPEWVNQMPMVKSAVRTMDAIEHYLLDKFKIKSEGFLLCGASKRGWTTWLAGAVDKRVVGIMPMVMDLLNMQVGLQNHFRALGGWSFPFEPYYNLNLTTLVGTDKIPLLGEIMDVLNYKEYLKIPKMVVSSTGDEFFLVEDDQAWWGDLEGPTWRLMVKNAEHSMATGMLEILDSAAAFMSSVMNNAEIPQFNWTIESGSGMITLQTSQKPSKATVYSATTNAYQTSGRRDFRLIMGNTAATHCHSLSISKVCLNSILWTGQDLAHKSLDNGIYTYQATKSLPGQSSYTAFFIELEFPGKSQSTHTFTTQVSVIPQQYPFDFGAPGDKGELL